MRATAEVRWFYPGAIPKAMARWFDEFDPTEEARRTDLYLRPTGDALNVKLREGQAEAKRRDAEGDLVELGEGITGRVERWRKWSLPLADEAPLPDDDYWLPVRKARHKAAFAPDATGQIAPTEAAPADGCEVELSRTEVGGDVWWSLCFEAYGEASRLRDLLLRTTAYVFKQPPPLRLDAGYSHGYVAWLRRTGQ